MDLTLIKNANRFLSRDWEIPALAHDNYDTWLNELTQYLTQRIQEMLDHQFESLIQAMYRLDIREHDFHKAMALPTKYEIAHKLAQLVIQREIEKAYTRMKYRS